ncbi:LysR family transcriptional regulator [Gordonia soli]|nr:LysR family transcriptional regulator [Gordonia soli]
MIDPHRLRVLRSVVAEGSITKAATALGYTSSAVSQHLSALARETGLVLLERDGRGIAPTEAGRLVAAEAAPVFDHLARVESLVADLRAGRAGRLSVSYFASAGAAWIPPIVATIAREFPDVRMDLRLIELMDEAHRAPDVEIYVEGDPSGGVDGYDCRQLVVEPFVALVPSGSAWADHARVTLRQLSAEPWVDNDIARGPCRQAVLEACAAAGFTPDFGVETQDYPTAIRFVAAGIGLTVVPRLAVTDLPDGVVVVPIVDPTPTRTIGVRVRRHVRDNPAVRRIVELLDDHARLADDTALAG